MEQYNKKMMVIYWNVFRTKLDVHVYQASCIAQPCQ